MRRIVGERGDSMTSPGALSVLFNPASVLVVGVSRDPIKRGRQVIRNVMSGGYAGTVYGVGRGLNEADGAPCFPTLADLPGPAEVAFLAVPAEAIADTLRDCATVGVKAAIVGAAGFAESADPESLARHAALEQAVADTGIRVVGPNCNGIYNANIGLALGFNAAHQIRITPGAVAIVSHSGALFSVMVGYLEKLRAGLSLFVSAGNEADLGMLDYLEHALADPPTKVVALLMDAIHDSARLRRLAVRARALDKHIVALKVGMSEIGAQAAVAHSSRLAGDAAAYRALLEACDIALVSSIEELMTTAAVLSFWGRASGGAALLTTSGAGAAMLADLADKHGIHLPPLRRETHDRILQVKSFSRIGNPVDLGSFERGRAEEIPTIVAADPDVGVVAALINPIDPNSGVPTLMRDIATAGRLSGKPHLVIAPGGFAKAQEDFYVPQGLRFVPDTECGLKAVAAMLRPRLEVAAICDVPVLAGLPAVETLLPHDRQLTEPESLALLARFGVPVVPTRLCRSLDEAVAAARHLGWPVALKGVVEGLAHKTEAGLVKLGLRDETALRAAHREMGAPGQFVVQPIVSSRAEAIAGLTFSADTGPMLVCGLGGIFAEALREVITCAVPASRDAIERKLDASALGRLLCSARWDGAKARTELVDALMALQALATWAGDRITAVDVNPILLGENGAMAVDGLVVPARSKEHHTS